MANTRSEPKPESPATTTPGRPKETGSRQQAVPGQSSQSGSKKFDRKATQRGGRAEKIPAKPDNVK